MSSKAVLLQELSHAKISHMRWVKRADHLISGLPVDKEFIPLEADSCVFGRKFLYGEIGDELRAMDNFKYLLEQIEFHHDSLHKNYGEIYKIYFMVPEKRSLLYKLTHFNSKEVSKKEKEEAVKYFDLLEKTSDDLIMLLDKIEIKIRASDFDKPLKFS